LLKDLRRAVYLIENHQLVVMICEVLVRVRELGAVIFVFKVEVDRILQPGDLERESCLSRLAWAQKGHGWDVTQ
jgi:hypothetical protein